MKVLSSAFVASLCLLASTSALSALQDPVGPARDLYAAAAYEEALLALQAIGESVGPEHARQADQYRAFCLLALGRHAEAEAAAEAAVRRDALALIDTREVSPRVEALFNGVRKRLLPTIIRDAYRTSRERMNRGDREAGLKDLARVKQMLEMSRSLGIADDTLTDLTVLVDGFLELHVPARASDAPAVSPNPQVSSSIPAVPLVKTPAAAGADAAVVPPVILRQDVPLIVLDRQNRADRRSGVIEVTIDERGTVRRATMIEPISARVDEQLLNAALAWRYRPATKNGTPIAYVKIVGVTVQ